MYWAVIAAALVLSIVSAWLVYWQGWNPAQAFLAVGGSAAVLIVLLIAVLWLLAPKEDRPEIFRPVVATVRSDLGDLLRWLGDGS